MKILELVAALAMVGLSSAATPIAAAWATVVVVAAFFTAMSLSGPTRSRASQSGP